MEITSRMLPNESWLADNVTTDECQSFTSAWGPILGFTMVLFAIAIWILVNFVIYGWKHKRWPKKLGTSNCERRIFLFAFLSPALAIMRLVCSTLTIIVGLNNRSVRSCDIIADVATIAYLVALLPAYVSLWFRQKALYGDKALVQLKTKFIGLLSWSSLILLVGTLSGASVLFSITVQYEVCSAGCVRTITKGSELDNVALYAVAVSLIVGQGLLLGLLIYPLQKYAKRNYNIHLICFCCTCKDDNNRNTESTEEQKPCNTVGHMNDAHSSTTHEIHVNNFQPLSSSSQYHSMEMTCQGSSGNDLTASEKQLPQKMHARRSTARVHTGKRLLAIMQRSVAGAFVCVIADLFALTIDGVALSQIRIHMLSNAVFDTSLIIRTLGLIMQFEGRRNIIFALCKK